MPPKPALDSLRLRLRCFADPEPLTAVPIVHGAPLGRACGWSDGGIVLDCTVARLQDPLAVIIAVRRRPPPDSACRCRTVTLTLRSSLPNQRSRHTPTLRAARRRHPKTPSTAVPSARQQRVAYQAQRLDHKLQLVRTAKPATSIPPNTVTPLPSPLVGGRPGGKLAHSPVHVRPCDFRSDDDSVAHVWVATCRMRSTRPI